MFLITRLQGNMYLWRVYRKNIGILLYPSMNLSPPLAPSIWWLCVYPSPSITVCVCILPSPIHLLPWPPSLSSFLSNIDVMTSNAQSKKWPNKKPKTDSTDQCLFVLPECILLSFVFWAWRDLNAYVLHLLLPCLATQEEINLAARRVSLAPVNRANIQSRSMSWRNGSLHWGRVGNEGIVFFDQSRAFFFFFFETVHIFEW